MPIILLSFILTFAYGGTLNVLGKRNYHLEYNQKKIMIQSPTINLTFENKACTQTMLDKFLNKLKTLEADKTLQVGHQVGGFNFILNGQNYFLPEESAKTKFIDSLPEELERMKLEEHFRCKSAVK